MSGRFDVVIVGAGVAGIGAARRLAQTRLSTLVLEAGPRCGGRAWTRQIAGLNLDLGCGWFHSAERNPWVALAESLGLGVDRSVAKWGVQYRDLGFSKESQAAAREAFGAWMQELERSPPPSDCAADALPEGGEWTNYIRIIGGFISGASLERLSVADYLAYDEASSKNNWRTPAGFGAVVAQSFPAAVALRLGTPVESVSLDESGVTLATQAGAVHARAVILTVSTAVLAGEHLKLPAELAPWRAAAARLPLGRNEKLFFEIVGDSPFAPESQVLGNPRDARSGSYYIRPLGSHVIEGFFGAEGARMVEESGSEAAFDFAIEQLCALFGSDIRAALRPLAASNWTQMNYIGGAYSYALPGHAAARKTLAMPFDSRVFFAGEATSARDFSTAHGAYESGVRAADEFIASRNT
ncbi:MAG: NAD(P)/FAD-dependent oxidoreductase [Pseudomonadota bacterium]